MAYSFLKWKLPRGQSFPLKRSVLDDALERAGVMEGVQAVYYHLWKPPVPVLRVSFSGEDRRGWPHRGTSSITLYAVASAERKLVELLLVSQGLPVVVRWLETIAAAGNTIRGPNQDLVFNVRDERLEWRSSLDAV
jgi:hypothetical protein